MGVKGAVHTGACCTSVTRGGDRRRRTDTQRRGHCAAAAIHTVQGAASSACPTATGRHTASPWARLPCIGLCHTGTGVARVCECGKGQGVTHTIQHGHFATDTHRGREGAHTHTAVVARGGAGAALAHAPVRGDTSLTIARLCARRRRQLLTLLRSCARGAINQTEGVPKLHATATGHRTG